MTALTAHDALKAFNKLATKVGPKAEFSIYLNNRHYVSLPKDEGALKAALSSTGSYSSGSLFCCDADTWEDLLKIAETKWEEHCDEHRRRTILDMAVAIIRITDEHGRCSDQMLRVEFAPGDVKRFGSDACAKANEMAGRGPFSIVETVGANARAA